MGYVYCEGESEVEMHFWYAHWLRLSLISHGEICRGATRCERMRHAYVGEAYGLSDDSLVKGAA